MTLRSAGRLLGCLVLCLGVGIIESIYTRPEIPTWYAGLTKPFWTPPPIAFPIVWTALYILMAIALWRLWDRAGPSKARRRAIGLFLVQLALTAIAIPADRRTGNQQRRSLRAALQPLQQLLGQGDPAGPQQRLAPVRPGPVGNRRAGQIDDGVERSHLFEAPRHGVIAGDIEHMGLDAF